MPKEEKKVNFKKKKPTYTNTQKKNFFFFLSLFLYSSVINSLIYFWRLTWEENSDGTEIGVNSGFDGTASTVAGTAAVFDSTTGTITEASTELEPFFFFN